MEQFIAKLFATRNAAHIAHLTTKSYAAHMALGDFYDGIPGAVDGLVEAWQGLGNNLGTVPTESAPSGNIISRLKQDIVWIEANRKSISGGDRALDNMLDDVRSSYLSTIYKLENLS